MKSFYLENLDSDQTYLREGLYLPLSKIKNIEGLKNSLTFYTEKKKVIQYYLTKTHIVVPRKFIKAEAIDLNPKKYKEINIKTKIELFEDQKPALEELQKQNGVLVFACGRGKTYIALELIKNRNVPAIIVVNTSTLLNQWRNRVLELTSVKEDDIGIIQGKTMDWRHDITLAMIQTLANRRNEIPDECRKYFGTIIFDEVDEAAVPVYGKAADIFLGDKYGLTSTPIRKDHLEVIYEMHIGPVIYKDLHQDLVPTLTFLPYFGVPPKNSNFLFDNKYAYAKIYTMLAEDSNRNKFILDEIDKLKKKGRKILVISERKAHLIDFHNKTKDSGLCIQETLPEDRVKYLKECSVIFAIRKLSKRGLDQQDLDTLFLVYPMSDFGSIQQATGRLLRKYKGKKAPEVYVLADMNIPPMLGICKKMVKYFKQEGYPIVNEREIKPKLIRKGFF